MASSDEPCGFYVKWNRKPHFKSQSDMTLFMFLKYHSGCCRAGEWAEESRLEEAGRPVKARGDSALDNSSGSGKTTLKKSRFGA